MTERPKQARRHLALEEVGSTNVMALEAARAGDPGPLWITAERQASGRGRRERTWISERGNLYASLLLVDAAPMPDLMNLPLVAALGVRQGICEIAVREPLDVRIKWPNDVFVNGRKCVGILLENERLFDGRSATVIGCGVNVENVPEGTPYPVTGLRREGVGASVAQVFEAVATGVENAIRLWQRGRNFSAVRSLWIRHAMGVGSSCSVNLPDETINGTFVDLDDLGRLVLEEASGRRRVISAGELFLIG